MDTAAITTKAQEYLSVEKDSLFRSQVEKLLQDKNFDELNDRFYTDLDFGTGGMRGVVGGGYNRMNSYTVQRATQGLANYIKELGIQDPSVAIAYDSRHFSDTFALDAARVLTGNGITTYLFTGLRPTPELSFAVRTLKATAGIIVTASHNPPQYNGYKVCWSDGGQVISPQDKEIVAHVRKVSSISSISKEEAISKGLLKMIDKEIDEAFIDMIKRQSLRPQLLRERGSSLKVVYTPLCGAGGMPVERALSDLGIKVIFVEEQRTPNGDFPTLTYPNPEEPSALKLAIELAQRTKADLVLATDPDSDRLGIAIPDKNGVYTLVTGNQLGVLLLDYIVTSRHELGTMPRRPAFIKTIVTTELQRLIADSYKVECHDTLTGFKYIADIMARFEQEKDGPTFLFGTEESYGFLIESEVRDKDAVGAAMLTAEMTLYHVSQGRSLLDRLNEIYQKYGFFEEIQISKGFTGEAGQKTMAALMENLRTSPPSVFAGVSVASVKDYLKGTTYVPASGETQKDIDLPPSNVLQFILSDKSIVTARPSGTEPKIKFYVSCRSEAGEDLTMARQKVKARSSAIALQVDQLIAKASA